MRSCAIAKCIGVLPVAEVQGSGGMAAHIADTPYAIGACLRLRPGELNMHCIQSKSGVLSISGYLDAGHGHGLEFQEVNLENAAGTWLTSKDALTATDTNGNNGVAAAGGISFSFLQLFHSVDVCECRVQQFFASG